LKNNKDKMQKKIVCAQCKHFLWIFFRAADYSRILENVLKKSARVPKPSGSNENSDGIIEEFCGQTALALITFLF
jgi:hypothetical protein